MRHLRELYEILDSSGDNKITKLEIIQALDRDTDIVAHYFPKHSHCMTNFFAAMDKNSDDAITLDEFLEVGMALLNERAV